MPARLTQVAIGMAAWATGFGENDCGAVGVVVWIMDEGSKSKCYIRLLVNGCSYWLASLEMAGEHFSMCERQPG